MASAFAHAVVAGSAYLATRPASWTAKVLVLGVFSSVMPDLDVIGFRFGVEYGDVWGHRGMTHSIFFAVIWSILLVEIFHRRSLLKQWIGLFLFYFFCTASHGFLDAMTTGGMGIGFFIPFDNERYFLPWRMIKVSSIRWQRFFSDHGLRVLQNEFYTVMLPSVLACIGILIVRRLSRFRS